MIELVDLVSENDEVIGKIDRADLILGKNPGYRVINAFLINKKGELWIPRRQKSKLFFPLHLDASIGGHVASGESYEDALFREAEEEAGLKITQFTQVEKLTPQKDGVSAFMKIYLIRYDEVPNYNKDDFAEYYWLSPAELLSLIKHGEKAKNDLEIIIKKIFPRLVAAASSLNDYNVLFVKPS